MHCVAERIKNCCDFAIDVGIEPPDVGHRQNDVLGKSARPVYSHSLRVGTQVATPGEAVPAAAANHVALAADQFSRMKVRYVRPDFDNFTDKFVPDDERNLYGFLRPVVPVVDVEIGSANPGLENTNLDVVNTNFRLLHIFQPQSSTITALYKCFH